MSEQDSVVTLRDAEQLLKALANATRLALVEQLGDGWRCVHELVDALALPQPLVLQHLRVLRTAGLVAGERFGQEVRYSLADDHVRHIAEDAIRHSREQRSRPMTQSTHSSHAQQPRSA